MKMSKTKNKIANAATYTVLAVFGLIWILPVIGIFAESFRCTGGELSAPAVSHWGWDNYARLFRETLFLKWFGNTLFVGAVTAIVQTAAQLSVGYVFSRFRFRNRRFLMGLIYVLGLFPAPLALVAVNGILRIWGLTGTRAPIGSIIVYTATSGMGYSIAKGFFDTVDRSVGEAAQVDGATQLQIFRKIYLPIARPIIIYTLLMGFMMPWNDLAIVDAILPGYMVADGLQWVLNGPIRDNFSTFCAGGVVVSVPIMILFLLLGKYYVAGETIRVTGNRHRRLK